MKANTLSWRFAKVSKKNLFLLFQQLLLLWNSRLPEKNCFEFKKLVVKVATLLDSPREDLRFYS